MGLSAKQNEHREVALKLLIGRSIALRDGNLPWSVEDDWALIELERRLWAELDELEQADEQTWLTWLWEAGKPGGRIQAADGSPAGRVFETEDHGVVEIVDEAFGLPRADYRPSSRGRPEGGVAEWLWGLGFQVVAELEPGVLLLQTPKNRVVPEVDRLAGLLKKSGRGEGVGLLACYDPVAGRAWIEVKGLT